MSKQNQKDTLLPSTEDRNGYDIEIIGLGGTFVSDDGPKSLSCEQRSSGGATIAHLPPTVTGL
jgi:hypothetical protein